MGTRVPGRSRPSHRRDRSDEPLEARIARGRSPQTPVLAIGSVAAVVWAIVTVLGAGALLLWWLL
jgi:hypothetical protein